MSYSWADAAHDEWLAEQGAEEFREEIVQEFTVECLCSFFLNHPDLGRPAVDALVEARNLLPVSPTACLVFAAASSEIAVKAVLLQPMIYGVVHQESVAALLAELALSRRGYKDFKKLLFQLLKDHGGVDLDAHVRSATNKPLWQEICEIQGRRNRAVHHMETHAAADAQHAIDVAEEILTEVFPALVRSLGLHLHIDHVVCDVDACNASIHPKTPI